MNKELLLNSKTDYAAAVEMARQFLYHNKTLSFEELLVSFAIVCLWKKEMDKRVAQIGDLELKKAYTCLAHLFAKYKDTYIKVVFIIWQKDLLYWMKQVITEPNVSEDLKNAIKVFAEMAVQEKFKFANDFAVVAKKL